MRYGLLCTSALISAGFVASQAQAADPIKLTLGGFYGAAAGAEIGGNNANGSPSDNRTWGAFKNNVEVYFNGSTTLDNGLTAGVHIELEANNTSGRTIDEVFTYFKGGFGEFRFGDTGGALGKSCVVDPGEITNNFGLISPNNSFTNVTRNGAIGLGGIGSCEDHGNQTKAVYFSPVFGGFQGVVSYAPGIGPGPGGRSAGPYTGTNSSKVDRNILEGSINFNKSFGAVSVTGNVAGEVTLASGGNGPIPWEGQGGLVIGFGRWQVGASGEYDANYNPWLGGGSSTAVSNSDDAWFASAGASYAIDAWTVGLEGIYGNLETTFGHDQYKAVSLQGTYKLGPGIRLEGEVAYFWYNQAHPNGGTGANGTSKSASVGIGSYMTF
jgi:outer membrane protein OmpU